MTPSSGFHRNAHKNNWQRMILKYLLEETIPIPITPRSVQYAEITWSTMNTPENSNGRLTSIVGRIWLKKIQKMTATAVTAKKIKSMKIEPSEHQT